MPATLSWARDRRDSLIMPDRGHASSASIGEVALPGVDLTYYKVSYDATSGTTRSRAT